MCSRNGQILHTQQPSNLICVVFLHLDNSSSKGSKNGYVFQEMGEYSFKQYTVMNFCIIQKSLSAFTLVLAERQNYKEQERRGLPCKLEMALTESQSKGLVDNCAL